MGSIHYGVGKHEAKSRVFRRSLIVVKDMKAGEVFTKENVHSIRPGYGLHTRYLTEILGRYTSRDIQRGTPLAWDMVSGSETTPPNGAMRMAAVARERHSAPASVK
jgi:N-acetylneuraminate synthase